jgi:predicted aspartyl protease
MGDGSRYLGLTHKVLKVKESRKATTESDIEFLIDSGAVYSLVPRPMLVTLGIEPYKQLTFILADGTKVERQVGDAYFEYQGEGGRSARYLRRAR